VNFAGKLAVKSDPNVLYALLKIWARLALWCYCGKITFRYKGGNAPCILACTHPNSFLDAIVMGSHMPRSLHFLARGDAFRKPRVASVLKAMHMIPIFRLSEGKENLQRNEETFNLSLNVLRQNGCILIFPEGICVNEHNVRPLKKGTARLSFSAWEEPGLDDLMIQPVSINYSSFSAVPKHIEVTFGEQIRKGDVKTVRELNDLLHDRLEAGMQPAATRKGHSILLALPALLGYITQRWFYVCWRNFAKKKTKNTVFYDSVVFCLLMLTYPIFVLAVTLLLVLTIGPWGWLALPLLPFTAWAYKEYRLFHTAE
jgi:1-acyl-sn-glycerol-3-phosphate acyltransferase